MSFQTRLLLLKMSCGFLPSCAPSCTIPSCLPSYGSSYGYPVGGLGSLGSCGGFYGGATSASSLGIAPGANIGCITQVPASQVVIQPAPCVVTLPGPILSTTCEPCRVGGFTTCLGGSSGGYGRLGGPFCGSPC